MTGYREGILKDHYYYYPSLHYIPRINRAVFVCDMHRTFEQDVLIRLLRVEHLL